VPDIDYDKLASSIANAIKGGNSAPSRGPDSNSSIQEVLKNFNTIGRTIRQTNSAWSVTSSILQGQNRQYSDMSREINDLYKQYRNAGTFEERKALADKRRELEKQVAFANTNAALVNFTNTAVKTTYELSKNFITALQSGGNDVDAVGNILSGGIGAVTNLGRQLPGVMGPLVGALGDVAQFGLGVLLTELKKTQEAFYKASSAGALFADGMTGLRSAANGAGLTLQQFSNVIAANRQTLAESGLGVGEAARLIGNVGQAIKTSGIRTQLLNLGFSFEEQAAITAEVIATMRRGNSALMQDPNAVAKATGDYATNLRVIASITGEDAKRKMEEAKAASAQVAVRLKLMEMEKRAPGITAAYEAAIATRSKAEQNAINQQLALGVVTDRTANILMSSNEGYRRGISGFVDLLNSGNTDVKDYQILQGQANDQFRNNLSGLQAIAQAQLAGAGGVLDDVGRAATAKLLESDKTSEKAVRNSQQQAENQKKTGDALTNSMTAFTETIQNLRVQLENALTGFLPQIAGLLTQVTNSLSSIVSFIGQIPGRLDQMFNIAMGGLIGGALGSLIGGILGLFTGPLAPVLSPLFASILGTTGAFMGSGIGANMGRAIGGPVNAGATYLVGERGPELFRPNQTGEIVPNNQLTTASAPMSGELASLMREQVLLLRQLVAGNTESVNAIGDLRSINQQILNNSY